MRAETGWIMCWTDERLPTCCFYSAHASWNYFTEFWVIKQQLRPACSTHNVISAVATVSSADILTLTTAHVFPAHLTWPRTVHCALLCTSQCVLQRCSSWLRPCSTVNKYRETNFQPAANWTVLLCSMEINCCAGGRGCRQQTAERKLHCYADCKVVWCKCDVMQCHCHYSVLKKEPRFTAIRTVGKAVLLLLLSKDTTRTDAADTLFV